MLLHRYEPGFPNPGCVKRPDQLVMSNIERRTHVRKPVRLACVVQFASGITLYGNTRDISLGGVNIESSPMSGPGSRQPAPGESGLLTLKFKREQVADAILVQCQVVHITPSGIGLSVRLNELSKREQQTLGQIIATGRAEI